MGIRNYILAAIAAITIAKGAKAQDFFNGQPGPTNFQLDSYATFGEDGLTLVPKLFLGRDKPCLLIAAPFSINDKLENKGINLGYIAQDNDIIAALGLFKDANGDYNTLVPQLYATITKDKFSLDLEASVPIDLRLREIGDPNASLTLGYGLTDLTRIGASVTQDGSLQAILRQELKPDHSYWAEAYIREDDVGLRFVANF